VIPLANLGHNISPYRMEEQPDVQQNLDLVMRALHRAHQDWPHREDIEFYASKNPGLFPYESVEACEMAIADYHRQEIEQSNIRDISRTIQFRALTAFLDRHMPEQDDFFQRQSPKRS
jgi:hypothetical protein